MRSQPLATTPPASPSMLLSAIFMLLVMAAPALADDRPGHEERRTMTLTGEGSVEAVPDEATISLGVVTENANATEAVAANNSAMEKVMAALKDRNIADRDLQTSNFDVSAIYAQNREVPNTPPKLTGYRVTNQLSVKVRKLANFGAVLDAAVKSGSNRINGISFGLSNLETHMNEARRRATMDAREKAKLYAEAAAITLGPIVSITEIDYGVPRRELRARAYAADAASVPIAAGEQEIEVKVNIIWTIE